MLQKLIFTSLFCILVLACIQTPKYNVDSVENRSKYFYKLHSELYFYYKYPNYNRNEPIPYFYYKNVKIELQEKYVVVDGEIFNGCWIEENVFKTGCCNTIIFSENLIKVKNITYSKVKL